MQSCVVTGTWNAYCVITLCALVVSGGAFSITADDYDDVDVQQLYSDYVSWLRDTRPGGGGGDVSDGYRADQDYDDTFNQCKFSV